MMQDTPVKSQSQIYFEGQVIKCEQDITETDTS
jgi:hypothetical protein